jgi:hypothetical protein
MTMTTPSSPKVQVATLYEKTSASGNRYFYGYLGAARVVMLLDTKTDNTDPTWQLFVSEGPSQGDRKATEQRKPYEGATKGRSEQRAMAAAATAQAPFHDDPLPF